MKRKSFLCYLFAAALVAGSLTACGGDDDPQPGNSTTKPSGPSVPDTPSTPSTPTNGNADIHEGFVAVPTNLPETMTLAEAKTPSDVLVAMGMGWNLGNQFDAHINGKGGETAWGQPKCTQATFTKLAEAGIKTVRIPITWGGNFGEAPDYKIAPTFMSRIVEVVGYAKSAGLNVIINIHHDGSADNEKNGPNFWLNIVKAASSAEANKEITATFTAIWKQVAEQFEDEGEYLIFECFNEIHNGSWWTGTSAQYKTLNEWNQAVVNTVRAVGGKNSTRWIGVPSYLTNIDKAVDANCFKMPTDDANRLMVSVHYYSPVDYTLNVKTGKWGHTSSTTAAITKGQNEKDAITDIRKMYDAFTSKGIPAYVGEMGNCNRGTKSENDFRAYYFEYVAKCMHDCLMPAVLWDNGVKDKNNEGKYNETHGYFNHGTGEWQNNFSKQMIDVLVKAMSGKNNDAEYTLKSVYDNAPAK